MATSQPLLTNPCVQIEGHGKTALTLFDEVKSQLGGLDVLVNNAGIAGAAAPVSDYPADTWHAVVDINLTGTFLVTQRAIELLKQSTAGSIIVMSSLAGRFGYANRVAYSTTKWASFFPMALGATMMARPGRFLEDRLN